MKPSSLRFTLLALLLASYTTRYVSPVWDDLRFPSITLKLAGAGNPDLVQVTNNGGSPGVSIYCFDPTGDEYLIGVAQLPHTYKAGTDVEAHIHWSPTDANANDVVWGLEYTLSPIEEVFSTTTTVATATVSTDSTDNKHHYDPLATITGTTLEESDVIIFRIYRDADNGADDYAADACLIEFDLHYQKDKAGTGKDIL